MLPPSPHLIRERLRDILRHGTLAFRTLKIRKHNNVYTPGDRGEMLYLVEGGQIKLLIPTLGGEECLSGIYTVGDLFGESCLAGSGAHLETATAMEDTILKGIYCRNFLAHLC